MELNMTTPKMYTDINIGNQGNHNTNNNNNTNVTSLLVRERLKNCVLNKRKSKEQGIHSNETILLNMGISQQQQQQQQQTQPPPPPQQQQQNDHILDKDLIQINQEQSVSNNCLINKHLNGKSIPLSNQNSISNNNNNNTNDNSCITPLTIDVENLSSHNQTIPMTSLPINMKKSNILHHQMQHSFSNHETDIHYMDFQNLHTSNMETSNCEKHIEQHDYSNHDHDHHQHRQQPNKLIDENLRKTVSEPSLKMRSGSGGVQKSRYKPDRRHYYHHHHHHFGMNTAAAAVAAAAITVSNDPLAMIGLWPQLTSAFQHTNLIQKTMNKKPLQQLQDLNNNNNSHISSIDSDERLTKSDRKSLTQSISPISNTIQDIILTEFMKRNQLINNQEVLETMNTDCTDSHPMDSSHSSFGITTLNSSILNSTMMNGFCTSLPNLTTQYHRTSSSSSSSLQTNNPNPNHRITNTTIPTNTSTPTTHHVTQSSFEYNEFNQTDTTISDLINNHGSNSMTQINQSFYHHLLPYYRYQSIGLISRTRSAPLSLATNSNTTNYRQIQLQNINHVHNLTQSMNKSISVTSAANLLAMEAATINFGNQQSNQSIIEYDQFNGINNTNNNNNELSSRSKVVLQLRKKILERSEFLTSDRSGVNILDGSNSPISRINQTTERGNPLLERTTSSPVVNMAPTIRSETVPEATFTTVLAYDLGMLAHHCTCQTDANHPENPQRLISIWQRLQQTGLAAQCHHQPGRRASLVELQLVHKDVYTVLFGSNPASRCRIDPTLLATVRLCRLACGGVGVDSDTAWHTAGHTAHAARLAAGCVVDLACRVMLGQCPNGFALVRPPGHHAEPGQAMGFCYFNSVAIAAKRAQFLGSTALGTERSSVISCLATTLFDQSTFLPYTMESALKPRILIVDWDIHHGNGTQTVFYTDPTVLYISLHRHDEGGFFPGTGSPEEIGSGPGEGFTINIAWPSGIVMSDAEYLAAFRLIILPVACEFQPSLVLISAGFDAAPGHSANLGGYSVSPAAFGWMTRLLSIDRIANSKVVLSLEGGYDMNSLCDCTEACVRALLRSAAEINEKNSIPINVPDLIPLKQSELDRVPHPSAIQTLLKVAQLHSAYWTSFSNEIDTQYASMPASSWLPTLFDNSIEIKDMNLTNEHISVVSTNDTTINGNKRFFKSFIKQTPFTDELNEITSENNTEHNNRYYNFTMRQASSMDETNENEMKPNSIIRRRRSTTGITASNINSISSIGDTNETITRIALTRLAELHVTSQPE
ncbi:unnamed protein product [Schistosoma margrebowiei]|uniref:histone deacetylase n=1 Tax=Schistosoma margrebowiei TaxID=48269 RepID=A0AA84ZTS7_9TREM|nr:unnamed protein product [Schistosoma margrebowiei]